MISIAFLGLGNRGRGYLRGFSRQEDVRVAALCDSSPPMLEDAAGKFPKARRFGRDEDFFAAGRLADWLVIATPDLCHVRHAGAALDLGYRIVLEKPVTADPMEMEALCAKARAAGGELLVSHVLRYSPFFRAVKGIVESGALGDIVNIAHEENVGYWHFAHSYVRGNWRSRAVAAPFLMAKCCHDFDLLHWLTGGRPCESVSAYGSLRYFKPENAPEGAVSHCLSGCPHVKSCPYSAEKLYLKKITPLFWGKAIAAGLPRAPAREDMRRILEHGNYGRCVFFSDNDVCDHHSVAMRFAGGVTATLSVSAFSLGFTRRIRVQGTKGELYGRDHAMRIHLHEFGKLPRIVRVRRGNPFSGHGGADAAFCAAAHAVMAGAPVDPENMTTIEQTRLSHQIVYAALESIETGRTIKMGGAIEIPGYEKNPG
ncbi:MAG: Gfo/Idh/MocA family oxidoreductase [Oscillospiraceae bacterium]|nr:Gfo/Idh/MocA family oxidoreductase [Oscillospiraceae bacterium]